jgi:hypothetical protein
LRGWIEFDPRHREDYKVLRILVFFRFDIRDTKERKKKLEKVQISIIQEFFTSYQ